MALELILMLLTRDIFLTCSVVQFYFSVPEATVITEGWKQEHNRERHHSSLDYLTPRGAFDKWKNEATLT